MLVKCATVFGAVMMLVLSCVNPADAQDEATKARVKAQIEALAKTKRDAAASANKQDDKQVSRDKAGVDAKADAAKAKVDRASASFGWIYGPEASGAKGKEIKQQVDGVADAQKAKLAADAARRAATRNAAADKAVQSLVDSAKGLKSQIPTKKGEYGLQPAGSNLNVRNYGTSK